jgi:hypothetical protein
MKCIVKDCKNHSHEGLFVGNLCSPCHVFVTEGKGFYSQAYRNIKREWIGLTDKEMKQVCYETFSYDPYVVASAIEAKLKEKNT